MTSIYERNRAYLLFMQNKESLHNFIILRKKQWTQMMTKKLKQGILNQQESIGFPKLSQVSTKEGVASRPCKSQKSGF